jgi:hypothetical protein
MTKLKAVMLLGLCCGCGSVAAAAMHDVPVDTLAYFKVKALFLPLYSYDHALHLADQGRLPDNVCGNRL